MTSNGLYILCVNYQKPAVKDLPKLRRISSFVAAEGTGLTAFLSRGRKLEGVPEPTSLQRK